jgi:outer membrane protein OmpA-like peptidoglycan-associated protein
MKLRNALLAATILALPVAANAQMSMGPLTGLYIGGGVGVNIMQNEDLSARTYGVPGFTSTQLQSRVGPAADLYLGGSIYGLRLEVEGAYRYNTLHNNGVGGQEQKFGPMVNLLYDLTGIVPVVAPYVGVGVGYQFVQERNVYINAPTVGYRVERSTQGDLAYQGIIGAALPVTPALAATIDYRFMGLVDHRDYNAESAIGGFARPATARFSNDFNHTVLIGLRYTFGVTPPAPAPVATPVAPAPVSRSYLVFFDWDKATLTDRARQIVAEAAANSTKVQYTQIQVNGYTDTSGTARYNQGLSVRRAQAVEAELVKDGVPQGAISIQGFGETHLLVPTGPNVREPQNRRVEIIIK